MRDLLPPGHLASLLAAFTPPLDPAEPEWTELCSALDSYDQAAQLGMNLDEARARVDTAATVLHPRYRHTSPPWALRAGDTRDRAEQAVVSTGPSGLIRGNR